MENTINAWIEKLKEEDTRYIETTIQYMMEFFNPQIEDDMEESVLSEISLIDFIELTDAGRAKIESKI